LDDMHVADNAGEVTMRIRPNPASAVDGAITFLFAPERPRPAATDRRR
jgi:hypothetical protein